MKIQNALNQGMVQYASFKSSCMLHNLIYDQKQVWTSILVKSQSLHCRMEADLVVLIHGDDLLICNTSEAPEAAAISISLL